MFAPGANPAAYATNALDRAADGVLALDGDQLTDDELRGAMVELRRAQSRLAAAVTELTATFDARRAWADDGSRSAADWLSYHAHRPRSQVACDVRVGRRLRTMPHVREAWRAGDISPAHAGALARLAGHPRAGAHFPDGEATLVDHARHLRFDDFERVTRYWLAAADPDGPERDRRRDHDLRRFSLDVGIDGVGHAAGRFTALGAATVAAALERVEQELFDADLAEARARLGETVTVTDLARTPAQRRHDALVEMAVRATSAPADGKRPAPLVTVMVGYETFAGRVCELARGTAIAPGTVAELLADDATLIERAVFDSPDHLLELSAARTFRGTLRRLLDIRRRRCEHPTCHVPAHRCQGDHVIPWSAGGETSQANGRLQCGPHNRWSYEQIRAGTTVSGTPPSSAAPEITADRHDVGRRAWAGPPAPGRRRRTHQRATHDLMLRGDGDGGVVLVRLRDDVMDIPLPG